MRGVVWFTGLLGASLAALCGQGELRLPTENHHLFTGQPERFYMYVDRNFEGVRTRPWEGGSFGFVRSPARVGGKLVFTRFHEGLDIAPVRRDKAGNPLDLVCAVADGKVAYVSHIPNRSNYGKYVVVEHEWEGAPVYSLYAHLAVITCVPGDPVKAGSVLGRMGYTGVGLDRVRAHLHLELCLMLSGRYDDWHRATGKGVNHHGLFNGMNLAGCDVASFFLERRKDPRLSFSRFLKTRAVQFKVAVSDAAASEFLARYPWLDMSAGARAASWEIRFTATGLPVGLEPRPRGVGAPFVSSVRPGPIPHRYLTRNLVSGEGNRASLAPGGAQLIALLTGDFPKAEEGAASAP